MIIFIDEATLDYDEFVEGDMTPEGLQGGETDYETERI